MNLALVEGWAVAKSPAPSQPCWFNLPSLVWAEHVHVSKAITVVFVIQMFTFTSTTEIFHCLEFWCWTGTWLEGNVHFHTHQQIWNVHCHLTEEHSTTLMWEREQDFERMDHYNWQNRLLLKPDSFLVIKTIEGVYLTTTGSPKSMLP